MIPCSCGIWVRNKHLAAESSPVNGTWVAGGLVGETPAQGLHSQTSPTKTDALAGASGWDWSFILWRVGLG